MMRNRVLHVLVVLALCVGLAAIAAAEQKANLRVGDSHFVCDCGKQCCETISSKEGKCGCGKELVKATVAGVEDGKAWFKSEGWEKERAFTTAGLYVCDCGPECKCNTVSDSPGKCRCGKELKKIEG